MKYNSLLSNDNNIKIDIEIQTEYEFDNNELNKFRDIISKQFKTINELFLEVNHRKKKINDLKNSIEKHDE